MGDLVRERDTSGVADWVVGEVGGGYGRMACTG